MEDHLSASVSLGFCVGVCLPPPAYLCMCLCLSACIDCQAESKRDSEPRRQHQGDGKAEVNRGRLSEIDKGNRRRFRSASPSSHHSSKSTRVCFLTCNRKLLQSLQYVKLKTRKQMCAASQKPCSVSSKLSSSSSAMKLPQQYEKREVSA